MAVKKKKKKKVARRKRRNAPDPRAQVRALAAKVKAVERELGATIVNPRRRPTVRWWRFELRSATRKLLATRVGRGTIAAARKEAARLASTKVGRASVHQVDLDGPHPSKPKG